MNANGGVQFPPRGVCGSRRVHHSDPAGHGRRQDVCVLSYTRQGSLKLIKTLLCNQSNSSSLPSSPLQRWQCCTWWYSSGARLWRQVYNIPQDPRDTENMSFFGFVLFHIASLNHNSSLSYLQYIQSYLQHMSTQGHMWVIGLTNSQTAIHLYILNNIIPLIISVVLNIFSLHSWAQAINNVAVEILGSFDEYAATSSCSTDMLITACLKALDTRRTSQYIFITQSASEMWWKSRC